MGKVTAAHKVARDIAYLQSRGLEIQQHGRFLKYRRRVDQRWSTFAVIVPDPEDGGTYGDPNDLSLERHLVEND